MRRCKLNWMLQKLRVAYYTFYFSPCQTKVSLTIHPWRRSGQKLQSIQKKIYAHMQPSHMPVVCVPPMWTHIWQKCVCEEAPRTETFHNSLWAAFLPFFLIREKGSTQSSAIQVNKQAAQSPISPSQHEGRREREKRNEREVLLPELPQDWPIA